MLKIEENQRVAIFIDVQNMFYSAKHQHDSKLDFEKLLKLISRKRVVVRAIAYAVETEEIDQSNFFDFLTRMGIEVKKKPLRLRADGSSKGDWDMGLAIDALMISEKVDTIILVSGDGDFLHLINALKYKGTRAEVASFTNSSTKDLIAAADCHFPLDKDILIENKVKSNNKISKKPLKKTVKSNKLNKTKKGQ